MATAGSLTPQVIEIGDRMPMVTGPTPMWVGRGFPTKISVGRPITTDAGRGSRTKVGFGFPVTISNGVRPGFPGERVATTSVGLRCHRVVGRLFTRADRLPDMSMSNSI